MEHYQCRPEVKEAGGIPSLVPLLVSEYPLIQELTLKSLCSCMHDGGYGGRVYVVGEGCSGGGRWYSKVGGGGGVCKRTPGGVCELDVLSGFKVCMGFNWNLDGCHGSV